MLKVLIYKIVNSLCFVLIFIFFLYPHSPYMLCLYLMKLLAWRFLSIDTTLNTGGSFSILSYMPIQMWVSVSLGLSYLMQINGDIEKYTWSHVLLFWLCELQELSIRCDFLHSNYRRISSKGVNAWQVFRICRDVDAERSDMNSQTLPRLRRHYNDAIF